jgi:dynamin 1-like protein
LTYKQCGYKRCYGDQNIIDDPIVLNIYSSTCPDLTLIYLPDITKKQIGDAPSNIKEITKDIASRY